MLFSPIKKCRLYMQDFLQLRMLPQKASVHKDTMELALCDNARSAMEHGPKIIYRRATRARHILVTDQRRGSPGRH